MAKKKETKSVETLEKPTENTEPQILDLKQFLENKVIQELGKPKNFSHVRAINTWENRWRINVYSKEEGFITKFKIVNSFFGIWENEELITKPQLEKIYQK
jgi:hypothetical protein